MVAVVVVVAMAVVAVMVGVRHKCLANGNASGMVHPAKTTAVHNGHNWAIPIFLQEEPRSIRHRHVDNTVTEPRAAARFSALVMQVKAPRFGTAAS